ncbi:MAG: RDD family protein [Bdellovibrionales bacterium]|jgi:uncharacterized RDD family membrane protein YckC|nr:RDD family protein [Bdellovibrionales bacterium]
MVLRDPLEKPRERSARHSKASDGFALPFDRLASHVADFVLLLPIMALAMAPFRRSGIEARLLGDSYGADLALVKGLLAALAVGVLWETFFVALWGTSPGRAIFGLRVVDMWTGGKPRLIHAFARAVTWWASLFVLGAPFFGVYGNAKRRPIHDRVADTEVRSRSTRRQSAAPRLAELATGSLFATLALFFATMALSGQVFTFRENAKIADKKMEPDLCQDVSVAFARWENLVVKPTRISVALGLSAAGTVEPSCLELEADYALWNNQGRVLGYLGKALTYYGVDSGQAEKYFGKVCELEPDSDACRMVEWYREVAEYDSSRAQEEVGTDTLDKIARQMTTTRSSEVWPDWMRLLVLKEMFVHRGDPDLILQLTQDPAQDETIGAKLVEYRTRALWRLDQKREAKATFFSAADALPRRQRVVLASWLCSRELYEASCSQDADRACDMMERSAQVEQGDFGVPALLLASLRHAECRVDKGRSTTASFSQFADRVKKAADEEGRKLVETVHVLRFEDRRLGMEILRQMASEEDLSGSLYLTEANIRLIEEIAKEPSSNKEATKELLQLRERWFSSRDARRYADWGRALFEALSRRGEWQRAAEVGVMLGAEFEFDQRLQRRIAVAAWNAGKRKLAADLVDSLEKSRLPASVEGGAFLRRSSSGSLDSSAEATAEVSGESAKERDVIELIRRSGRRR